MTQPNHVVEVESLEEAADILGVAADADERRLRAAYMRGVQAHPPDIDAAAFERVRDAYELLRDPRRRAQWWLDNKRMPVLNQS